MKTFLKNARYFVREVGSAYRYGASERGHLNTVGRLLGGLLLIALWYVRDGIDAYERWLRK